MHEYSIFDKLLLICLDNIKLFQKVTYAGHAHYFAFW